MSLRVGTLHAVMGLDSSGFDRGINQSENKMSKFASKIGTILKGAAFAGVAAAGVAIGAVMVKGISDALGREQLVNRFNMIFKNLGGEAYASVKRLSTQLAVPMEQVAELYTKFGTSGRSIPEIEKITQTIYDMSGALGLSSEQTDGFILSMAQMESKGTVSMEEIRQAQERGIDMVRLYAEATGQSTAEVQKQIESGKLTSKEFIDIVVKGADKYSGAWAQNVLTTKGAVEAIKFTAIGLFGDLVEQWMKDLGKNKFLGNLAQQFIDFRKQVQEGGLGKAIMNLFPPEFQQTIRDAMEGFQIFGEGISKIFKPIGEILANIGKAVGAVFLTIGTLFKKFEPDLRLALDGFVQFYDKAIKPLAEALIPLGVIIGAVLVGAFILLGQILGGLAKIISPITTAVRDLLQAIVEAPAGWAAAWEQFKKDMALTWTMIKAWFKAFWDGLVAWWNNSMSKVKTDWNNFWTGISNFFTGIWNGIKNTVTNVWNSITTGISNAWNTIKSTVSNAANNVWKTITDKFDAVKKTIGDVWQWVKDKLGSMFDFKIPKIKLPHFKMSGSINPFDWGSNPPKFGIDWYKNGGIIGAFQSMLSNISPTGSGGRLIGAGEAGAEAIVPMTGSAADRWAAALAGRMQEMGIGRGSGEPAPVYVFVSGEQVSAIVSREQYKQTTRKNRARGI